MPTQGVERHIPLIPRQELQRFFSSQIIIFDPYRNRLIRGRIEIQLTSPESLFLNLLLLNRGQIVQSEDLHTLLAERSRKEAIHPKYVAMIMSRLKRKLDRCQPLFSWHYVRTVRLGGYALAHAETIEYWPQQIGYMPGPTARRR